MTLVIAVTGGPEFARIRPGYNCSNRWARSNTASSDETQAERRKKTLQRNRNRSERPRPVEESRNSYLGRVLAKPMSHLGAPWLIRPESGRRRASLRIFQAVEAC